MAKKVEDKDKGRFPLSRKITDHWTWKHPRYRGAWIWMLVNAAYKDHDGIKRGQLRFSVTQGKEIFGMSTTQTRRFFTKLATPGPWNDYEAEIVWEKGKYGGRNVGAPLGAPLGATSGAPGGATPGLVTLLNYDRYNSLVDTCGDALGATSGHPEGHPKGALKKERTERKKEDVPASNETGKTPNTQVYDFYIQGRRVVINMPEWKPTGNQAEQMRANINTLLATYSADTIVSWLKNYFADKDEWIVKKRWAWTVFMKDPVQWSPGQNKPSNKLEDLPPRDPEIDNMGAELAKRQPPKPKPDEEFLF